MAIIGGALIVFIVTLAIILNLFKLWPWPSFLEAVTTTTTKTKHYTPGEGGKRVHEIQVEKTRQDITIWHIIGAIVIPISGGFLIGWLGFRFNEKQREREQVVENQQAQDSALQAYLDQMSDLLVNQHLRSLPTGSDIHRLAEARTSTVLLGLDRDRKRRPLKLVYDLQLIKKGANVGETDGTLLSLENLSLDHADLTELTLREASLRSADLRAADLQGSDLSGANLSHADLRGANLTNVDLSNADLRGANLSPYDEQEPARLSLHNLKDHALPSYEYLHSLAKLQKNQRLAKEQERKRLDKQRARREKEVPRGRIRRLLRRLRDSLMPTMAVSSTEGVTSTDLTNTRLSSANLDGAILANANLRGVRGGLTPKQIERSIGNRETKLPEGLEPPPTWSDEIEDQIKQTNIFN